jgi:hypothetical protein
MYTGEGVRNEYILFETYKKKTKSGSLAVYGSIILKWIFKEQGAEVS